MSERNLGLELGPEQELQGPLTKLEARRLQLIEAGEIVEPDIVGSEAVELVSDTLQQGLALTRELLNGQALRLTKQEVDQLVEDYVGIEIFSTDWREQFTQTGSAITSIEGLRDEATILFPGDLGDQEEYELADQVQYVWNNNVHPLPDLIEGISEPVEQRRILLDYLSQYS